MVTVYWGCVSSLILFWYYLIFLVSLFHWYSHSQRINFLAKFLEEIYENLNSWAAKFENLAMDQRPGFSSRGIRGPAKNVA